MPFGNIGTKICRATQGDLFTYFGNNIPALRTLGSSSTIKWLLSPQNTRGFRQIDVESVPGKKKPAAFMLDLPFCLELCAINASCTTARQYTDPETSEIVFDLTNAPFRVCDGEGEPVKLRFKLGDLMKYCDQGNEQWIKDQISRYLMAFEEALDKAIVLALSTKFGRNFANEVVTQVPLWVTNSTTNTVALNPESVFWLGQTMRNIGIDGNYAMIGGAIVNKYAQFNKWTCCNDAGVDMSKADAMNPWPFYDRNFDTQIATNRFGLLSPGAVQLVTWNQYKGERRQQVTDLYTKSTVVLPTTGLMVDYTWEYDYKCEVWEFEAFLHAELAVVPAGGCPTGQNANGLILVEDCSAKPVAPVCPEVG